VIWLKVGAGIAALYWLMTRTKTGAQVVAAAVGCPAGSVPGPWFSCQAKCQPGWAYGVSDGSNTWLPAGTGYCYGGGTISVFDDSGNTLATSGTNSTAATGVDGNTITVDPNGVTSPDGR
jgi:hypothetical protein